MIGFKSTSSSVFAAVAISILLLLSGCVNRGGGEPDLRAKHLVVIGVDAMSPDGILNANTPVLDQLIREGAYTFNARAVLPTSSSTNWASMVSGAGPEQHGVTSNSWERESHSLSAVVTGMEDIFPTIFSIAREQRPDLEMGAIYTWGGFGRLIESSALNYNKTSGSDEETTELAVNYLLDKKPGFLFIQFDDVDHTGHDKGHKTQDYYEAVSIADALIGKIIQASKDAGTFKDTVFIISADHGGINFGHGGATLDEIEIPFIVYGKNVKSGYQIRENVYTYDNAATMAVVLGVEQHQAWIGQPIKSAFKGFIDSDGGELNTYVPPPVLYPVVRGGLYVDTPVVVEMRVNTKGTEIRYTLDGFEPSDQSTLYTAPFKLTQSATVKAKAFTSENQQSLSSIRVYHLFKSTSKNGLLYEYFEDKDETWQLIPDFGKLTAKASGRTFSFNVDNIKQRNDFFAIRYSAWLEIDTSGEYTFYSISDDGSKVRIDDEAIVDNDGGHGREERFGTITLDKGLHKMTVDYFNMASGIWLDVQYKGPGISKRPVPVEKLFIEG